MAETEENAANASNPGSAKASAAAAPAPPSVEARRDLRADIAEILKGVKLPERHARDDGANRSSPAPRPSAPAPIDPIGAHAPVEEEREGGEPEKKPPSGAVSPAEGGSPIVALHTLKDDMQQVVRIEKMSLVRAASLEQDRAGRKAKTVEEAPGRKQRRRRVSAIVFAAALFAVLGVAAIAGVLFIMSQHAPQVLPIQPSPLIFAEQSVVFPLEGSSPDRLKQHVADMRASPPGSLGSITRVVPTVRAAGGGSPPANRPATAQEFLSAVGAHPPDELARALGDDFFFGIHTIDKNAPVFVFQVVSYEHAFAGMLAWESSMDANLAPIFSVVSAYTADKDGIPHERRFEDVIMRNYDARVLKDDGGAVVLYYSFPAPNVLVIAESPYSFAEILTRLRAQRRL